MAIDPDLLPAGAVEAATRGRVHEVTARHAVAAFLDELLTDDDVMLSLVQRYEGRGMIGFGDPRPGKMRAALTAIVQESQ